MFCEQGVLLLKVLLLFVGLMERLQRCHKGVVVVSYLVGWPPYDPGRSKMKIGMIGGIALGVFEKKLRGDEGDGSPILFMTREVSIRFEMMHDKCRLLQDVMIYPSDLTDNQWGLIKDPHYIYSLDGIFLRGVSLKYDVEC